MAVQEKSEGRSLRFFVCPIINAAQKILIHCAAPAWRQERLHGLPTRISSNEYRRNFADRARLNTENAAKSSKDAVGNAD